MTKKKKNDEVSEELAMLRRVNAKNPSDDDKKAFNAFLEKNPGYLDKFSIQGITNADIFSEQVGYMYGRIARNEIKKIRDNLGYENSTEMEKLLIKQICLNWVRLNLMEMVHGQKLRDSHSTEAGLYWSKSLDSAQRRFTRVVESLAKVRRLLSDADLKDEQAKIKRLRAEAIALKNAKLVGGKSNAGLLTSDLEN